MVISRQLGAAFSSEVSIEIVLPPEERLAKIGQRLAALGVSLDPYSAPPLWVHAALPAELRRTLLLPADSLVLSDARELFGAALRGKAAAVFEECSTLFETVFNYRHKLFAEKQ